MWRALRLKGEPPHHAPCRLELRLECTVSDAKARAEMGYRPVISREDGLAALGAAA